MKLTSRNGKLWIDFYHQSKRYRRSLELDDNKANRKLAESKIIPELTYKLNSGAFFENEVSKIEAEIPSVGEFYQTSLELHRCERGKETQNDYITIYNHHILPYLGSKKLNSIKPSDIAIWQNKLLDVVSARRVRKIRIVLNVLFEDAIRNEIIDKNPISLVKVPKVTRTEVIPFSHEEMLKILMYAQGDLKNFCALGFFTGMRSGEMLGLKWEISATQRQKRVTGWLKS